MVTRAGKSNDKYQPNFNALNFFQKKLHLIFSQLASMMSQNRVVEHSRHS